MPLPKNKKYDVGILGWWYGKNYGSILTYYGLNKAITKLGYNVLMVHEALGYNQWRVKWPDDIVSMNFAKRSGYNTTKQDHFSKLSALNSDVGTFLVGSDQLWNPLIGRVNDDLFLDFVSPENRRMAYATSFGNRNSKKFKPDFVGKHTENLKKFAAISVREDYAVDTAREVFDVEATKVVDPVFLLSVQEYEALAEQATVKFTGEYLSVFYLDITPEKRRVAEAIADKLGIRRIVVIPNPDGGRALANEVFQGERFEVLSEDAPENFLNAYKNAKYALTDSFHGSAFAVIFQKPFSSIYNTKRGVDRFKSLMQSLGFGDSRRVYETDGAEEINNNENVSLKIDFSKAAEYMDVERDKSLRWLSDAISSAPAPVRRGDFFGAVKEKSQRFLSPKGNASKGASQVDRLGFVANNEAWRIATEKQATRLTVAPGAAVRGNQVWCDLPLPLQKQAAYRLTLKWAVRTTVPAINLHIRNKETGKFVVAGKVVVKGRTGSSRTDTVDFIVREDGFSQFMLGAIHFSGTDAGADISDISLKEIKPSDVVTPKNKPSNPKEVIKEVSLKDTERFFGSYAQNMVSRNKGNARAIIMFHSHAVEKGLTHTDFRPGFGKISIPKLAKELNTWIAAGKSTDDTFFKIGVSVMHSYFERHKSLGFDVSEFWNQFDAPIQELIDQTDASQGGVLAAELMRETRIESNQDRSFLDVVFKRRSVREFIAAPVANDDIERAVQIAMQAPSVCNRQPARVHRFDDPRTIRAAVKLQGGFGGYEIPPKLLLVTCDLEAFLFAVERNQAFIDGGLFMMGLLLGLEQVGLGACSLNTAMSIEREGALRKLLNIPESEVFISFIAVGHFDPSVMVCRSKRMPLDEVLEL